VANAIMKLMAPDQAQPQLRDQKRDGSVVWDELTSFIGVFVPQSARSICLPPWQHIQTVVYRRQRKPGGCRLPNPGPAEYEPLTNLVSALGHLAVEENCGRTTPFPCERSRRI
jgi:hypothetical protein